jgi:hypothetical protein
MIAQKVVDAKQSQIPRRSRIAAPDLVAPALGAPASEHAYTAFGHTYSASPKGRPEFKVAAAVWSYSNRSVQERPWPAAWPLAPVTILFLWSLAQPQRRDRP